MAHVALVESYARKVAARIGNTPMVDVDDLRSEGFVAILNAADRYDRSAGVTFGVYVKRRVMGSMLDLLRRVDMLPKNKRRAHKKLMVSIDQLRQELQREPTDFDVSEDSGEFPMSIKNPAQVVTMNGQSVSVTDDQADEVVEYVRMMVQWDSRKWVQCMLAWHYIGGMSITHISRHLGVSFLSLARARRQSLERLRAELVTSGTHCDDVLRLGPAPESLWNYLAHERR